MSNVLHHFGAPMSKQVKVSPFSLCPFRSPVGLPEESKLFRPTDASPNPGEKPPLQSLGPCLGVACGLWCVTSLSKDNQPADGMCSLKLASAALNAIANKYAVGPQPPPTPN